ncbi:hypothetical protein MRX96_058098 [Rhipicephalus microplus]
MKEAGFVVSRSRVTPTSMAARRPISLSLDAYRERIMAAAQFHNSRKIIGEIYTDWANHYLERSRHKRYIQDLQSDVTDGSVARRRH